MTVEKLERILLTDSEDKLLHNARNLLIHIYEEASDSNICASAGIARDAINKLFSYCE